MRVLFAVAEVAPFSKCGGLADVAAALPAELARRGVEMQVISPLYSAVNMKHHGIRSAGITGTVSLGRRAHSYRVAQRSGLDGLPITHLFIENREFYDRPGIYTQPDGRGYPDNAARFFFFQKVIVDLISRDLLRPDVIHLNDHHTAVIPLLLEEKGIHVQTLLTIHNFQYQGQFTSTELLFLDRHVRRRIKERFGPEERGSYSALEIGIASAGLINTVSRTYAKELLRNERLSFGLHGRLISARNRFTGILNGADYSVWDPGVDPHLDVHYDAGSLEGKRENKKKLLDKSGLPLRLEKPLTGSVSRLVESKGFDLIFAIAGKLVALDIQMVFLGEGDRKIATGLDSLAHRYPDHVSFHDGFDEELAHLIEAGADMFLMPSDFEPSGLNQIYSLRYGTIPIVHRTGGLADTVRNWDGSTGNGFVFERYTAAALLRAVKRATRAYRQPRVWRHIMQNAMREDFSWKRSAGEYLGLYRDLMPGKT